MNYGDVVRFVRFFREKMYTGNDAQVRYLGFIVLHWLVGITSILIENAVGPTGAL